MKEHPAWVAAFNGAQARGPLLRREMGAAAAGHGLRALGARRPAVVRDAAARCRRRWARGTTRRGRCFYGEPAAEPLRRRAHARLRARRHRRAKSLGQDDAPDILAVSLSGHDYVNHAWGARVAPVARPRAAGRPAPRRLLPRPRPQGRARTITSWSSRPTTASCRCRSTRQSQGRDGGRLHRGQTLASLEAGLAKRFGEGPWARGWSAHGILLDHAARREARRRRARRSTRRPQRLLLAEPGVAAAFTRARARGRLDAGPRPSSMPCARPGTASVSADLQVVPKPGWMLTSYAHRHDARLAARLRHARADPLLRPARG